MGVFLLAETHPLEESERGRMSLHIMPGETKNIIFHLPDEIETVTSLDVRFYDEDEEELFAYDESSEEIYAMQGFPKAFGLTVPPEDTILYENREKGVVQVEWAIGDVVKIAKATRISCGVNYNHDGGEA